jgi:hypothetical protein
MPRDARRKIKIYVEPFTGTNGRSCWAAYYRRRDWKKGCVGGVGRTAHEALVYLVSMHSDPHGRLVAPHRKRRRAER